MIDRPETLGLYLLGSICVDVSQISMTLTVHGRQRGVCLHVLVHGGHYLDSLLQENLEGSIHIHSPLLFRRHQSCHCYMQAELCQYCLRPLPQAFIPCCRQIRMLVWMMQP